MIQVHCQSELEPSRSQRLKTKVKIESQAKSMARALNLQESERSRKLKTIEILNTDAEGRLTLADALVYADKLGKVTATRQTHAHPNPPNSTHGRPTPPKPPTHFHL